MPAYKFNVHKFPRIFALLSEIKTGMWSYFFLSLTFLVNKYLCVNFQVLWCDPYDMGALEKIPSENNKAKLYRVIA